MTKSSPSRAQRRSAAKNTNLRQPKISQQPILNTPAGEGDLVNMKQFNALVSDTRKLFEQIKLLDNHIWMMLETMQRKGVLGWSDVNETEALYLKRNQLKTEKVKELLQKELDTEEMLEEISEDPKLPGYEKLDINPIKDLNLNPYEVASCLKEANISFTAEQFLEMGKRWGLQNDHFGFKTEES